MDRHRLLAALGPGPTSAGSLAEQFGVTRQAVHYHLRRLEQAGQVRKVGAGRATRWERVFDAVFTWPLQPAPAEDLLWKEAQAALGDELSALSDETRRCLDYGVTELLNNAIDHAQGTAVDLAVRFVADEVEVVVTDDGIGALRNVREHFGLPSDADAAAHIAKGQQTTAPDAHSGQGLFFTSKLFDRFELDSGANTWKVDNFRGDATVGPGTGVAGTRVRLRIAKRGTRTPRDVFDRFSGPESYSIDRTELAVRLADHGSEFMSRSEAKRLAVGLELYGLVTLDFAGVREVGQGFVDELFRVWPARHPGTRIVAVNASPEVDFMVRRGLPDAGP